MISLFHFTSGVIDKNLIYLTEVLQYRHVQRSMENKVKRIGYLPRKRVLEIIDEISKTESISRSKVVGILVEEALDARGIANFGYSNISKSNIYNSVNYKDLQNKNAHLKDAEDEFVDDSGYTVSSHKTLDRSISSADIELANKINILKESGLI